MYLLEDFIIVEPTSSFISETYVISIVITLFSICVIYIYIYILKVMVLFKKKNQTELIR
jgi:hypothetical protein